MSKTKNQWTAADYDHEGERDEDIEEILRDIVDGYLDKHLQKIAGAAFKRRDTIDPGWRELIRQTRVQDEAMSDTSRPNGVVPVVPTLCFYAHSAGVIPEVDLFAYRNKKYSKEEIIGSVVQMPRSVPRRQYLAQEYVLILSVQVKMRIKVLTGERRNQFHRVPVELFDHLFRR